MKCKGRAIHPSFRENFCGRKRVVKDFPCVSCDLLELTPKERKQWLEECKILEEEEEKRRKGKDEMWNLW
jgi:hypothetical protein